MLKIKKGTSRIVMIVSFLPFVIKFPVIKIKGAIGEIRRVGIVKFVRFTYRHRRASMGSWTCLYGGIAANQREFSLFLKTRDKRLMPTYFSFFGMFNIQKKGSKEGVYPEGLDIVDFRINGDSHAAVNPANFLDGRLVDYGDNDAVDYFVRK